MSRDAFALYVRATLPSTAIAERVRMMLSSDGRPAFCEDWPAAAQHVCTALEDIDEAELWDDAAGSVVGATWEVDATLELIESVADNEPPKQVAAILRALATCGAASVLACLDCDPEAGAEGPMYLRWTGDDVEVIDLREDERDALFDLDFAPALEQLEKRFAR